MTTKKTFKNRVLDCIGEQKPTSWGLSIGLNTGIITRIFTHDKIPTGRHLITISKALNKSIDWLLTGEERVTGKKTVENAVDSVKDTEADYIREAHRELIQKLVDVLEGANRVNAKAIEQNINAFYLNKDADIPDENYIVHKPITQKAKYIKKTTKGG